MLLAAVYGLYRWARPATNIKSIVVLPFQNLTGDPQNEYLADGVTEQLTDSLARIPDVRVVARTSAFEFKGKGMDIRRVGAQLNADAVIEGSLRNMDGRLQLTVQINRSQNGYHILSQTLDGGPQDLARLESDVTALALQAVRPGAALSRNRAPDPQAYDLYLKARALCCVGTRDAFERAVRYLNEAIERDPKYADPYAALAGVYAAAVDFASEPLEYARKSKALAANALELDSHSGPAHSALGLADSAVFLDWNRGEQELRTAIRLVPQDATAHNRLGCVLMAEARFPEAVTELRAAGDLNPLAANVTLGLAYYLARQYDAAIQQQFATCIPILPLYIHFSGGFRAKAQLGKGYGRVRDKLAELPLLCEAAHCTPARGNGQEE